MFRHEPIPILHFTSTLNMPIRSVCVIGGTGFIGRHVVHQLSERNISVVVPARRRSKGHDLLLLPTVDVVEADLYDPQQLARVVEGQDAVINLVGILKEDRRGDFHRVHEDLPRRIVEACRVHKVGRLIHFSAIGASHDSGSQYMRSKAGGEAQVRLALSADIRTTILRPSVVFGPDDAFLMPLACLLRMTPVLMLPCGHTRFAPVYVEDVARVCVQALDRPDTHAQTLSLCGPDEYTFAELARFLARTMGLNRTILPLNDTLSFAFATLTEWLPGAPLTRDMVRATRSNSVCTGAFPEFAGPPTSLEACAPGWLGGKDARGYDRYRSLHK
jgi:NADH dehydrogenase